MEKQNSFNFAGYGALRLMPRQPNIQPKQGNERNYIAGSHIFGTRQVVLSSGKLRTPRGSCNCIAFTHCGTCGCNKKTNLNLHSRSATLKMAFRNIKLMMEKANNGVHQE